MTDAKIIQDLLKRLLVDELNEAELACLNDAVCSSEAVCNDYVKTIYLREGIRRWAQSRGSAYELQVINAATMAACDQSSLSPGLTDDQSVLPTPIWERNIGYYSTSNYGTKQWLEKHLRLLSTVAALFLVTCLGYLLWFNSGANPSSSNMSLGSDLTLSQSEFALSESDTVVARLTAASSDIKWTHDRAPSDFLMRFRPGEILGIETGIAQVEFCGGARLVLRSPASLQFTGGTSARLIHGQITGRAEGSNFALVTPSATVVDIGTEFGVGVGPEGTEVTVFEGELQVHSLLQNGEGGLMRRVLEGTSMRIDAHGTPAELNDVDKYVYNRNWLHPTIPQEKQSNVSLLDLVGGHDYYPHARIAGSIDPRSGYWGKPPWMGTGKPKAIRGDTQFTSTPWNRMIDGVFIPRANAREMQIDSDGHVVHLPPNRGTTWGPIWARRHTKIDRNKKIIADNHHDFWGGGTLESVHARLLNSQDGLLGLHANVGITFDLDAVRDVQNAELVEFRSILLNLGTTLEQNSAIGQATADLRIFVDGKLRYSRLDFNAEDGEVEVIMPLKANDRFLTLVATDADGNPSLDHVVFVDPVLQLLERHTLAQLSQPDILQVAQN